MRFDAVMVMGKELRLDPTRGARELRARAAAASALSRKNAAVLMALEAPLKGQERSGSAIVAAHWEALGHLSEHLVLRTETYSTRQEAMLGARLADAHGFQRIAVVTASYHLARTRQLFSDHLPLNRVCILAPEACLRFASPEERTWILEGTVSPEDLKWESEREKRWERMERLIRPLPSSLRWKLECQAGRLLRHKDSVLV